MAAVSQMFFLVPPVTCMGESRNLEIPSRGCKSSAFTNEL